MKLTNLSDAQLLDSLKTVCGEGRVVLARLLAHLIEVEDRRLHLEAACPSIFQFCVRRLGMSEDEACRRIHAARLARRFPDLLARIERGELTLSTIALLHDALAESNYGELVEAAAGKTKAEVQALLARRSPSPDVPAAITIIPVQQAISNSRHCTGACPRGSSRTAAGAALGDASQGAVHGERRAAQQARTRTGFQRHSNADGDLAVVVERAVDLLLGKLEKQRLGKTTRPQESREERELSAVSRATRRAVFERDGERCDHRSEALTTTPVQTILREALAVLT